MQQIAREAQSNPELLHTAPHNTPIRRPDDVRAVKDGIFKMPAID